MKAKKKTAKKQKSAGAEFAERGKNKQLRELREELLAVYTILEDPLLKLARLDMRKAAKHLQGRIAELRDKVEGTRAA